MTGPSLNEAVEWRVGIWAPAIQSALERAANLLPSKARVLEVGYNNGILSCYLACQYGWNMVGYEIRQVAMEQAKNRSVQYGVENRTDFRICRPDETLLLRGQYDAIVLKSVLYHIDDKREYSRWIEWLYSTIRLNGVIIAVENGRGGMADQIFRRIIKRSRWANHLLFDRWVEQEFKRRFRIVDVKYFGRFSQFLSPWPNVCGVARTIENKLFPPNANHCFIASIVAQK